MAQPSKSISDPLAVLAAARQRQTPQPLPTLPTAPRQEPPQVRNRRKIAVEPSEPSIFFPPPGGAATFDWNPHDDYKEAEARRWAGLGKWETAFLTAGCMRIPDRKGALVAELQIMEGLQK